VLIAPPISIRNGCIVDMADRDDNNRDAAVLFRKILWHRQRSGVFPPVRIQVRVADELR